MQFSVIFALASAGFVLASPRPSPVEHLQPRQTDRACFHQGSVALCCPESGDELFATNCTTPSVTSSALGFYHACKKENLTAQCCTSETKGGAGFICAPVPSNPPTTG